MTFNTKETQSLMSNIFDYEHKSSTLGTEGEVGSGFGLPLCIDIMRAHGGNLRVQSELGKGTTFYVVLPEPPSFPPIRMKSEVPL